MILGITIRFPAHLLLDGFERKPFGLTVIFGGHDIVQLAGPTGARFDPDRHWLEAYDAKHEGGGAPLVRRSLGCRLCGRSRP